jgi:16S rRNA processing protein RimM
MPVLNEQIVSMGHIATAFGVRGELKVKVSTEVPDSLLNFKQIYLSINNKWLAYKIDKLKVIDPKTLIIKLYGVEDRDQALLLKGTVIGALREEFPKLPEGEYYWVDLIGLKVYNKENYCLGQVKSLLETGANDVIECANEELGKLILIPFIEQYIVLVDLAQGKIVVDWGLDY